MLVIQQYGQRNLVDEYVSSLVNTLALYKGADLRLSTFAMFLSESWDTDTFLDFVTANSLALQVRAR